MLKWNIVFLITTLLISCAVKQQHPFIGDWQLVGATFLLPESCRNSTISFTEDGLLMSTSGSLKEIKAYTVIPYRKGYLIETHHIMDNNKINCQGIPAIYARYLPVNKIYLEVLKQGHNLKLHFHPEKDKGYLIVERL